MKKIYVDMSLFYEQNGYLTGAGEYAIKILSSLLRKSDCLFYVGLQKQNSYPPKLLDLIKQNTVIYYERIEDLQTVIAERDIGVVFLPQYFDSFFSLVLPSNIKIFATLHDLDSVLELQYISKKRKGVWWSFDFLSATKYLLKRFVLSNFLKRKIVRKLNQEINSFQNLQLITVSHFSKSTFGYYFYNIKTPIHVFYPPLKIANACSKNELSKEIGNKYGISENSYFLFCSAARVRKNNAMALFAFDSFISKTKLPIKSVVIGSTPKFENYIMKRVINKDSFVFDEYVSESVMEELYKFARLFVFPSIIEGFGSPPVEAMKYNTLCACSTACSIPEVVQNAAILFDPYDEFSMELAYFKILDEEYVNILRSNISEVNKYIQNRQQDDLNKLVSLVCG